jgi:NAD-dependent dihydropyrimidine dehydrogenase PreA subunit
VNLGDAVAWLRDTAFRWFPHRVRPGLRSIGSPGPGSPVLVTGNYALTVRRMTRVLAGRNVWLLVADSRGINVWCAAGGGHFTHHDIVAAVKVSRIETLVEHRTLLLPQLAATGVERGRLAEAVGWSVQWGPARLEDLPEYLDRGQAPVRGRHRLMRFPLRERLEMGLAWGIPMAVVEVIALGVAWDIRLAGISAAVTMLMALGLFAALPRLPVAGARGWLTRAGIAVLAALLGAGMLRLVGLSNPTFVSVQAAACGIAMLVLSLDLAGSTPWYPSSINSFKNRFHLESAPDRCAGKAECVQVCPRAVLRLERPAGKVVIARPERCIHCGACIVQCPEDALRFRFSDGRIVEPATVRRTHLNLLGRRTGR